MTEATHTDLRFEIKINLAYTPHAAIQTSINLALTPTICLRHVLPDDTAPVRRHSHERGGVQGGTERRIHSDDWVARYIRPRHDPTYLVSGGEAEDECIDVGFIVEQAPARVQPF